MTSAQTPPTQEANIVPKGPTPSLPSTSSNSSPISSSSSYHATTPPHLSSPQTDTDGSLLSPPSIPSSYSSNPSSGMLPTLPAGFNESGQRIRSDLSRSSSQTTPTVSEISNPIPVLPPGFSSDGRKIDDIAEYLSPQDFVHPDHGPMPSDTPMSNLPLRSHTSPETENAVAIADLKVLVTNLQTELSLSNERMIKYEDEILRLQQQNEELLLDNKRLSSEKNRFESYISVVTGTSQGGSNGMGGATTPHSKFTNWSAPISSTHVYNRKRNTEPFFGTDGRTFNHRQSEPNMLNVPARPNKLPLNKKNGGLRNHPTSYSLEPSPMHELDGYRYISRQSPSSDTTGRERSLQARMTSSGDELTSGGEDRNSVRSFESGNSGNVTLTTQLTTTETVV